MKFVCAVLFACFVQSAVSQVVTDGQCAAVEAQAGIDNNKFLGLWYGNFKDSFAPTNAIKCNAACYSLNGNQLTVQNYGVTEMTGQAATIEPIVGEFTNAGTFVVTISGEKYSFTILAYDEQIGAAAIYSCDNISPTQKRTTLFGITRARDASTEAVNYAKTAFTQQDINLDDIRTNDQSNCPAVSC